MSTFPPINIFYVYIFICLPTHSFEIIYNCTNKFYYNYWIAMTKILRIPDFTWIYWLCLVIYFIFVLFTGINTDYVCWGQTRHWNNQKGSVLPVTWDKYGLEIQTSILNNIFKKRECVKYSTIYPSATVLLSAYLIQLQNKTPSTTLQLSG